MKTASAPKEEIFHILLVDDNHHGLIARKAVLEELGYKITTAKNAEEALEIHAARQFDLIVTDYKMPKMNGVEFIQKVRKSGSAVPMIMLSGFVEPLGLDEKTTGADVVISKSAGEVGNLVRSVNRLLRPAPARKPPTSQKPAAKNKAKA
jgi:CheY-like chemotaxis protein